MGRILGKRRKELPGQAPMILLENIKRIADGWRRPEHPQASLRECKAQTYPFNDDGVIPNHPRWPLIIYKRAVRLPECLDPAAVFEELFESRGWGSSWRDGIYDYAHYHSRTHEVRHRAGQRSRAIRRKKRTRSHFKGRGCGNPPRRHGPPTSECERRFSGFIANFAAWRTSRMIEGERSGGHQYGSG